MRQKLQLDLGIDESHDIKNDWQEKQNPLYGELSAVGNEASKKQRQ